MVDIENYQFLCKTHSTLPVYNSKLLTAYRRPPNAKDLLVWADCAIKPSHKKETGFLPVLNSQGHSQAQASNKLLYTYFFQKRLVTSSNSLTDLTHGVGPHVHQSKSITFLSKPLRRKCTYSKCQFCPLLRYTFKCITTSIKYSCKHIYDCHKILLNVLI